MNYTPIGGSFTSVPAGTVHQFTSTNKFGQNVVAPAGQAQPTLLHLPITVPGSKPGDPPQQQVLQIQVVTPASQTIGTLTAPMTLQNFSTGNAVFHLAFNNTQGETIEIPQLIYTSQPQVEQGSSTETNGETHLNNNNNNSQTNPTHIQTADALTEVDKSTQTPGKGAVTIVKVEKDKNCYSEPEQQYVLPANWQGAIVTDCLKLPVGESTLSTYIKLQADSIKREQELEDSPLSSQSDGMVTAVDEDPLAQAQECQTAVMPDGTQAQIIVMTPGGDKKNSKVKKKYKKKPPKQRRQMPGRVIISTDEDGSKQYHCPECVVRCTEMELLEQHLALHKTERRFICDLCGAALKRKEHLERHKLGHNPERPYTCDTCFKGFKRKEHLNLHVVIHSGEKTQVCTECGKGFYRKDHLRKHARSHLTKKIKEESGLVMPVHLQEQGSGQDSEQGQATQTINDSTRVLMILPDVADHPDVSEDASMEGHPHQLEATVILPAGVDGGGTMTGTMTLMQQHQPHH